MAKVSIVKLEASTDCPAARLDTLPATLLNEAGVADAYSLKKRTAGRRRAATCTGWVRALRSAAFSRVGARER